MNIKVKFLIIFLAIVIVLFLIIDAFLLIKYYKNISPKSKTQTIETSEIQTSPTLFPEVLKGTILDIPADFVGIKNIEINSENRTVLIDFVRSVDRDNQTLDTGDGVVEHLIKLEPDAVFYKQTLQTDGSFRLETASLNDIVPTQTKIAMPCYDLDCTIGKIIYIIE